MVAQAVDSNATGTPSHNHHFMGAFGAFLWENLIGLQQGVCFRRAGHC